MTIALYARRKGWALDHVTVRLRHSRVHATDCADCDTKTAKLDRIEREVELTGTLTPEQHSVLLGIADRCPVHRTLVSGLDIRTPAE